MERPSIFGKSFVPHGYEGTISMLYVPLADSFYNKFKEKDIAVLRRYGRILSAQNIFDGLFGFDDDRLTKFAAVKRIVSEYNQKSLEKKLKN